MKWSFLLAVVCFSFFAVSGQVNPQNGAAQIDIPLYNYADAGNNLFLNAHLVYTDGNGLPVSEMASSVGTGWNLECGGFIARVQHGEPDDQIMNNPPDPTLTASYPAYENTYYPNGYLFTSYSPADQIDNGGGFSPFTADLPPQVLSGIFKPNPVYLADRDQDIFVFSFNGRQGSFVIGKNMQPRTLEDSKLQISFQQTDMSASNVRTVISQFTITDENGIQYVFKDLELDNVVSFADVRQTWDNTDNINIFALDKKSYPKMQVANNGVNFILAQPINQYVINKWYLSQIINPFTQKSINLSYSSYNEDVYTDRQMQIASSSNTNGSINVYLNHYVAQAKRLSSVSLSNKESLNFIYDASPRKDMPNDNTLDQINVTYNNNYVYGWKFGYGYFVGIDGNVIKSPTDTYSDWELEASRLCLTSLQKTGQGIFTEPPYTFTYNLGSQTPGDWVPPMFSIYQDYGGYYNAQLFGSSVSEGFMDNFYPEQTLSGFITNYGGNGTYRTPYGAVAQNGIIQSVTFPAGGTLSYSYEENQTAQGPIAGVRVKTTTLTDGVSAANNIVTQYKYVIAADESTSSGWGAPDLVYTYSGTQQSQGCSGVSTTAPSPKDVATSAVNAGVSNAFLEFASEGAISSSLWSSLLGFTVQTFVTAILGIFESPKTVTSSYTVYSNVNANANNPLPWGYARTEEVRLSGNAGKTVYEFTNPSDLPIQVPSLPVLQSNRPRYAPWAYGLPKTITVYDNNNNIIKQTVNHYNPIVNVLNDPNFESSTWRPNTVWSSCNFEPTATAGTNWIDQDYYYPFTGHTELVSSEERIYNSSQQYNSVTTNYIYNTNYQLQQKWFYNSKGEKVQTFYYYPADYPQATGALGIMNQTASNVIAPLISTESYINKSDGNMYMIAGTTTQYSQIADGAVKPTNVYTFQNTFPLVSASLQPFNPANPVRDPNYFKQTALDSYDANGNLIQSVTHSNRIISCIYDYDGKLLVATATNASYNDIGYSSFEAEGGKPGSKINTAAIVSTDARTGNKCFNLILLCQI